MIDYIILITMRTKLKDHFPFFIKHRSLNEITKEKSLNVLTKKSTRGLLYTKISMA